MAEPSRSSPMAVQIVLLVAFLLVVAAAVFTVLIPDLREEPDPTPAGQPDAGSGESLP